MVHMTDLCVEKEDPRVHSEMAQTYVLGEHHMQKQWFTGTGIRLNEQRSHRHVVQNALQAFLQWPTSVSVLVRSETKCVQI